MNKLDFNASWQKAICFWLLIFSFQLSLFAQLPNGVIDAKVQDGYVSPMGVIFSKNGQRMFVWEKAGKIWCSNWNGSTYVKQASPMLDISGEVGDWRDFGFSSICLDPNFDTNGLIYMFYMVDRQPEAIMEQMFRIKMKAIKPLKTFVNNPLPQPSMQ